MSTYTDKAVYVVSCHNRGQRGNIKFTPENITESITTLCYEPDNNLLRTHGDLKILNNPTPFLNKLKDALLRCMAGNNNILVTEVCLRFT